MPGLLAPSSQTNWETLWAPYDQPTYDLVLAQLDAADIVLDIGAGDLRLARAMASLVRHVYAIEINPALNARSRRSLPANLTLLEGDALRLAFPQVLTCGVLLMRHCTHFREYFDKLKQASAKRLLTNARWRMGVEVVDLTAPRLPYEQIPYGWYACCCGATGFKAGPAEALTGETIPTSHEICTCPTCTLKSPSGKDRTL